MIKAPKYWTQAQAIAFCREIEALAPSLGWHVALTGGTLYKDGERKDVDIHFYRIRQMRLPDDELRIAADELLDHLADKLGLAIGEKYGWVIKAKRLFQNIDFFFPEFQPENDAWSAYL